MVVVVDQDEHPRSTTLEKLSALPTPFRENGTVTAGNASGVNDGAAAMIIASEEAIKTHALTPIARIVGGAVAGVGVVEVPVLFHDAGGEHGEAERDECEADHRISKGPGEGRETTGCARYSMRYQGAEHEETGWAPRR